MKNDHHPRKPIAMAWWLAGTLLAVGALCPAQIPARSYWDTLVGGNAVTVMFLSVSGNTNPFDPSHTVSPGASVDATMTLAGYVRTFALFDRAASAAINLPMGRISGDISAAGSTVGEWADGFGDPMLEFTLNLIGPPAQKNLADLIRYEPGFSMDLLADLAVPVGEYDHATSLNIGQNRWYGRVGFPIVWQFGPWVPGRRTTLEFLPSVWLFGTNDDFVGQTLETDPKVEVEGHLTRDFTDRVWGSLDGVWYHGGKSTIDGVEGEALDNLGVGFTLGYQINDGLGLTFGYKSTIDDSGPGDMRMNIFTVSLVAGWHPMVEGMRRLKSE
jgi:hypothetical protein